MTKWISVEDDPPKMGIDVWIYPFEDTPGYSLNTCAAYQVKGQWFELGGDKVGAPTHWAEIDWPEPPEKAKP